MHMADDALMAWTFTAHGQHVPAAQVTHAEAVQRARYNSSFAFDPWDETFGRTGNVVGNRMVTDAEAAVDAMLGRQRGGR